MRGLAELVCSRDLAGEVRIVDVGLVGLRRENRSLQGDQRRVVGLQATIHLLIEVDVLLVVIEPKSWQQAKAIAEGQFDLAEQGGAGVAIGDVLIEAIAIEQSGSGRE